MSQHKESEWRVITFAAVSHALRAEKIVQAAGFSAVLIPVPRSLSQSCEGLALRLLAGDAAAAAALLEEKGVPLLQKGVAY